MSNEIIPIHDALDMIASQEDKEDSVNILSDMKKIERIEHYPNGKFGPGNTAANKGKHSLAKKVAAMIRVKLASPDPTDPQGRAQLELIINNLCSIATNTNPKTMKEAIWAFSALMERAFGAPLKSEEELEAIRESGVKIIVVSPNEIVSPTTVPLLAPADFIDVGEEE